MKLSADGHEVPDRIWYYLLDWNEINEKQEIKKSFRKEALKDLTLREINILFCTAYHRDFQMLTKKVYHDNRKKHN